MTSESKPPWQVICLTPVRNEAWILRAFLTAASEWADTIVVADQGSDDDSGEIAREFPKVRLVQNDSPVFDELLRQRLLIDYARKIPGPKLLVALDADEFLTPDFFSGSWVGQLVSAGPGAVLCAPLLNVRPGLTHFWVGLPALVIGVFDDGRPHEGRRIHATRVPCGPDAPRVQVAPGGLLHWQYTAWSRMLSKQRWYQCWERVNYPDRNPLRLYRQYHHMDAITASQLQALPPAWLEWFSRRGVELDRISAPPPFWWDREVLQFMSIHGARYFRRDAIWDVNWRELADGLGLGDVDRFKDPRRVWHRWLHAWLRLTQCFERALPVRIVDRFLRALF